MNYYRCISGCSCHRCYKQPTNPSNKTVVVPVEGASFIDQYRAYYPEDTRTDKEIIDSQFRHPAESVPNSATQATEIYDENQVNSIIEELRTLKQSLIDGGYLESDE